MKNKKGFTLVELLAVIVILAVIMLVAITSIGPMMANSRKSALGTEGIALIKSATTAYNAEGLKGPNAEFTSTSTVCMSLKYLNEKGYFEKSIADGYDGSVLVIYDSSEHKNKYLVWITNGTYMYLGIDTNEIDPENAIEYDEVIASTINSCPSVTSIPTVNISGSTYEKYKEVEPTKLCDEESCGEYEIPADSPGEEPHIDGEEICNEAGFIERVVDGEFVTTTESCKATEYQVPTEACNGGKQSYTTLYYEGGVATGRTSAYAKKTCSDDDNFISQNFTDEINTTWWIGCKKYIVSYCQDEEQTGALCMTDKGFIYRKSYTHEGPCGYRDDITTPEMKI